MIESGSLADRSVTYPDPRSLRDHVPQGYQCAYRCRSTCSGALVQPGQDELAMTKRLGCGQAAVDGAQHVLKQRVAGLIERHFAAQYARYVNVDVLGHG